MSPKVSICVPNLNCRPYLAERFQTIFEQTLQDWEVLVVRQLFRRRRLGIHQ